MTPCIKCFFHPSTFLCISLPTTFISYTLLQINFNLRKVVSVSTCDCAIQKSRNRIFERPLRVNHRWKHDNVSLTSVERHIFKLNFFPIATNDHLSSLHSIKHSSEIDFHSPSRRWWDDGRQDGQKPHALINQPSIVVIIFLRNGNNPRHSSTKSRINRFE